MTTMTTIFSRQGRAALRAGIVLLAAAAFFNSACSDGPTAPKPGSIRFMVTTTGGDPDLDGYQLVVDASPPVSVLPNTIMVIGNLSASAHTVSLSGIADNCSIAAAQPVTVTVAASDTVTAVLSVVCEATGIRASAQTTGEDKPFQFQVQVGNNPASSLPVNGSLVLSRLSPGAYTVTLIAPQNCTVTNNPITVEVSNRILAPAAFEISCAYVPRLGKIAFYRYDQTTSVYNMVLVNPDGSELMTLAPGYAPAWSQDGQTLVYTTRLCDYYTYDCTGGIETIDPETGSHHSTPYVGYSPAWSPDGARIAFTDDFGTLNIGRMDVMAAPLQLAISAVRYAYSPAWSPDGESIAFSCYRSVGASNQSDLCLVRSDGTGLQFLTSDIAYDGQPAWSPDGGRIAFETSRFENRTNIAVMTVASGAVTRVVQGYNPAWSPQGSALVFNGEDGVFTILPDGSNLQRVTTGQHYDPTWRQ